MSRRYQAGILGVGFNPLLAPNAPTSIIPTAASTTTMSVAFTAPSNIGGSAITGYTVVASNGQTATGATSPVVVSGLSIGTSYTFVVYANNVYGPSPASVTSASVSTYKVPGAPLGITATAGNAQATVSFSPPSDLGIPASITGYRVTSSPGGFTATGASSPITVTGLTNGTAYTFTVEAQNAAGYGPASSASNSVTPINNETPLYAFTSYTFTKAGATTNRNGPTLAQCQSAYAGTAFIGSYFAVPVQGVQQLTIPSTGTYRITAAGAKGGNQGQQAASQGDAVNAGGSGRVMVATVTLNKGDLVYILVGQQGQGYTSTGQGSGGGGGTFISKGENWTTSTLLVAAGGGGGSSGGNGGVVASQNGQSGTSGGGWGGGTSGNGGTEGTGSEAGAPGGGWLSGGLAGASYPGAQIRSGTTATGAQSVYGDSSNTGGFGGGASGWGASGGGGGYSGGGAQSTSSNTNNRNSAGGGGSYVDGTLVSNSGLNYGDGYLTLEKL